VRDRIVHPYARRRRGVGTKLRSDSAVSMVWSASSSECRRRHDALWHVSKCLQCVATTDDVQVGIISGAIVHVTWNRRVKPTSSEAVLDQCSPIPGASEKAVAEGDFLTGNLSAESWQIHPANGPRSAGPFRIGPDRSDTLFRREFLGWYLVPQAGHSIPLVEGGKTETPFGY